MDKTPGENYLDDYREFEKSFFPSKKQKIEGQGKLLRVLLNGDKRLSPPEFTAFSEMDKSYVMKAILKLTWAQEDDFAPGKVFLYEEENYNLFLQAYKN